MFLYNLKQTTPTEEIEHPVALETPISTLAVDMQVSIDDVLASIAQIMCISVDPKNDFLSVSPIDRVMTVELGELRTQIRT